MNKKIISMLMDEVKTEVFKRGTMNTLAQVGFQDQEQHEGALMIIESIRRDLNGPSIVKTGIGNS